MVSRLILIVLGVLSLVLGLGQVMKRFKEQVLWDNLD
ncbi:hypothetical protein HNQ88_004234 [Aureibacter tunicatorum]|uniref:Uncharacterized protein n=1 Tax=Aureibacter tunicatorum TaxID=866807 RepID=A0AAE3XQZ7_9BACT|nr:hypothetical protein [Aureibacter tunicatorum]